MKYIGIAVVVAVSIIGAYVLLKTEADAPILETDEIAAQETMHTGDDIAAEDVRAMLHGGWQSVDDAQFVRRFSERAYEDWYADELVSGGSWSVFVSHDMPDAFPYPVADDTQYLVLDAGDESLYFSIAEYTDTQLALIYLNRGGVLEFRRVAE